MEWIILIILSANMEPVMWLESYKTEDACKTAITETVSPMFDKETHILAPYPKYKCFNFNEKK